MQKRLYEWEAIDLFFKRFFTALILFSFVLNIVFPQKAFAYINPGTGSLIFQLIIAAGLGGLVFLKLYWEKVKQFVSKPKDEKTNEQ